MPKRTVWPKVLGVMGIFLAAIDGALVAPPPCWSLIPFGALLLAIALGPMLSPGWWHRWHSRIVAGLALLVVGWYGLVRGQWTPVGHALSEYAAFITLIGSLYVIAGGILIKVTGEASPGVNVIFLLIGAVLANFIGTTGASLVLLPPWMRMNKYRYTGYHTAFFIFLIGNIGGSLTPIGDPPLLMGFLKGIPFFWFLEHLWRPWLALVVLLVALFYLMDWMNFRRATREVRTNKTAHETWEFQGGVNPLLIGVVLAAVFLPATWREFTMLGAAMISLWKTPRLVRAANHFSFAPLREVAWLFLGIFITMIPALECIAARTANSSRLQPEQWFWVTGGLSAVLDNAPTYLTMLAASVGQYVHPLTGQALTLSDPVSMARYILVGRTELIAISLAAVWFGAMTYIGNGPNLMVKALVERSGLKTPGFLPFIFQYSLPILLPAIAIIAWIFF